MLSVVSPALILAVAPVTLIIALSLVVSAQTSGAVVGFALARTLSIGIATGAVAFASSVMAPDTVALRTVASVLELALAAILLGIAVWAWIRRSERVEEPAWMMRVGEIGWRFGAAVGLVIWLVNPKAVVTVIITGLVFGAASAPVAAGSIAAFTLLGSAPVLAIALTRALVGTSAGAFFARIRKWLIERGWSVLTAISLLVALLLLFDALGGLAK